MVLQGLSTRRTSLFLCTRHLHHHHTNHQVELSAIDVVFSAEFYDDDNDKVANLRTSTFETTFALNAQTHTPPFPPLFFPFPFSMISAHASKLFSFLLRDGKRGSFSLAFRSSNNWHLVKTYWTILVRWWCWTLMSIMSMQSDSWVYIEFLFCF